MPLGNPREYYVYRRKHVPYLNWFETFDIFFCSYFNCLVAYTREIAGRTEKYWCPIKHSRNIKGHHSQYSNFIGHTQGDILRKEWKNLRKFE